MQIIIFNQKGGVGKSMLATQIALYFDATILELDPYGVLSQTLSDDMVYKVGLKDELPEVVQGDVIYDFGGFDDKRVDIAAKGADLIIIPFNPTINSLGTTLESYERVKNLGLPVLFVINAVIKEQDALDAIEYLKETLQSNDLEFFIIPHTRALQTSENEGLSILSLAASSGLKRHTYRKISAKMQDLMNLIKSYI
ncbi:ParA family protein [Sulfurimonas sp. NWX79]|uniref:ParA family protein n=1 Tax=Sulfurimonas sp. NWX79 TaxID=2925412 RepID=UPI003204A526